MPKPRGLTGAIALVEGAVSQRVLVAVDGLVVPGDNAFGERVAVERGTDVVGLVRRGAEAAAGGERVALVARAIDLAAARGELARVASRGVGLVVHAITEPGPPDAPACESGLAPALTLGDLPWGILLAAGISDAIDLALVARRAAEDSGCPFIVVHEPGYGEDAEPVAAPSRELADALLGGARPPSPPPSATTERGFAERAPFALASAMRSLEGLTGRRHDVILRHPAADAQIALVGAGALGQAVLSDVDRQHRAGHEVAAVRVVAWRPFPAARLVKALCRALAIGVLEGVDRPLAANGPLASQLKAAFADALTWAPGYPGIGHIPRLVTGVVAARHPLGGADLDGLVHNILAHERGARSMLLGGDETATSPVPSPSSPSR
jgi:pyruvate-ferredoxin/flavodoxin oxidoreductase